MEPAKDGNTQEFAPGADEASTDPTRDSDVAEGNASEETAQAATPDGDESVEKLREECDFYKDQVQRKMAEFDNYRRRVTREREQVTRRITVELFRRILPLHDDLRLAVQSESDLDDAAAAQLRDGLKLIASKFDQLLVDYHVEEVPSVGSPFDPSLHEAMFQEETDEVPEGQILEVFEQGFQLGDELIRPARVKVAKGKSGE